MAPSVVDEAARNFQHLLAILMEGSFYGDGRMKEESFSLPLGDGHKLYGRINYATEPAHKAVVLCHGLTGNMNERHYQMARDFFTAHGYDVIRFNFYGDDPDARRITDCTIAQHAKDLERVLQNFRPRYEALFASGHSFGGLTILRANSSLITAVSLWDSTFIPFAEDKKFSAQWSYSKERGDYVVNWSPVTKIVGKKFYDETRTFTTDRMRQWGKNFTKPVQIIAAGAFNDNLPYQKKLFESLSSRQKEFTSIAGASHGFIEGNTIFELLENTHRWFELALTPEFNKTARKAEKDAPTTTPTPKRKRRFSPFRQK